MHPLPPIELVDDVRHDNTREACAERRGSGTKAAMMNDRAYLVKQPAMGYGASVIHIVGDLYTIECFVPSLDNGARLRLWS
jgi:hypothetical protein